MLALLKLIPLKDWLYGGVIVALLIGFGVFVHHERNVGATSVITADAAAVAKQVAHNTEIETHAQQTVTQISETYAKAVAAPPAADAPHLWVRNNSLSTCPAGTNAGTPGSTDGGPVVSAAVPSAGESAPDAFDFGPPLDKSFETADAQIIGLQDYIKACQTAGICLR